jgi:DNA-binding transcriptional MerR regulator
MIQICQQAGLSLAEIKELARRDRGRRIALIESKRAQIAQQVSNLRRADKFLAHIAHCEHPVISECPECAALTNPGRRVGRRAAR